MNFTKRTWKDLATIASATLVSMAGGFLYPFIFKPVSQPAGPEWHPHVNGLVIGMLIGLAISLGELYLFQVRFRRLRFSFFILAQTLYYLAVIHVAVTSVMVGHYVALHGQGFSETVNSVVFKTFFRSNEFLVINVYALSMIFVVSFVRQINRMLGQNALINFITGKYHKPVEEERVFMFLDLKDSTSIAERLGHKRYHQFLNDFFYDMTPAIVESKGQIYQYVGDEVVITWSKERGLQNANCINCYFGIAAAIAGQEDKYEHKYGFQPKFKAGYHFGTVIAGLIGDIKRDIVFHGDTVNTAARIRSECSVVRRDLLMSSQLLSRLSISSYLTPESMGKIKLRGKEEEIELYSIREAA